MSNFKNFKNEMMNIHIENNKRMAELFDNTINTQVEKAFEEKFNQHIDELVTDMLIKFERKITNKIDKNNQNVHDRINQAGEYVKALEEDVEFELSNFKKDVTHVKGKVDTLEFNGRSKELGDYIHSKIFNSTGINKESIEYTLFFGNLNRELQGKIKKKYGINRYGLLPVEELDSCKELIDNWFPPANYRSKYMQEYRRRNDSKKGLPCTLKKAYEEYLDINNGVIH